MSKTKNDFYNKKENRIIYVLLSPSEKIFYINHCLNSSFKETYRHNIKGRRESTKKFINQISPERPCVFVLENMSLTKSEAYNYVLVWIKIFLENGYECFNSTKLIELTNYLYFNNRKLYDQKKTINLKNILSCENCLIPVYNHLTCEYYHKNNDETETEK